MLKHVNGYGLSKSMNHQFNVKSRFHPGAKITHENIRSNIQVNASKLHLNKKDNTIFVSNFEI